MKRVLLSGILSAALAAAAVTAVAARGTQPGATPAAAAPAAGPKPTLLTMDGLQKALKKNRGRAVLLHFWATWCLPCLEELPTISQFAKEMKPRGLDVVSISLDSSSAKTKVSEVLQLRAPNLSPYIYSDDTGRLLSAIDPQWQGAIPAVFAYDQKGEMRGRFISGASRQQLVDLVGYMLKPARPVKSGKN